MAAEAFSLDNMTNTKDPMTDNFRFTVPAVLDPREGGPSAYWCCVGPNAASYS